MLARLVLNPLYQALIDVYDLFPWMYRSSFSTCPVVEKMGFKIRPGDGLLPLSRVLFGSGVDPPFSIIEKNVHQYEYCHALRVSYTWYIPLHLGHIRYPSSNRDSFGVAGAVLNQSWLFFIMFSVLSSSFSVPQTFVYRTTLKMVCSPKHRLRSHT